MRDVDLGSLAERHNRISRKMLVKAALSEQVWHATSACVPRRGDDGWCALTRRHHSEREGR